MDNNKDVGSDDVDSDDKHFNDGSNRSNSAMILYQESHTRSIVKGLTWRIVATSTTTIIAWIITGRIEAALQIGVLEFFAKLAIYYIHERIWTRIPL